MADSWAPRIVRNKCCLPLGLCYFCYSKPYKLRRLSWFFSPMGILSSVSLNPLLFTHYCIPRTSWVLDESAPLTSSNPTHVGQGYTEKSHLKTNKQKKKTKNKNKNKNKKPKAKNKNKNQPNKNKNTHTNKQTRSWKNWSRSHGNTVYQLVPVVCSAWLFIEPRTTCQAPTSGDINH